MSNTILACEAVCKNYYDGQLNVQVLDNLTLQVEKGRSIGIVGASGSGKSTLLHILGGLDKPTSGRVSLMGQDLSELSQKQLSRLRNRHLGFVYQFHHLLPEFSALENVMMPLLIGKRPKEQARERALLMLEKVGLKNRVQHRPGELSGGERQRAAIARALGRCRQTVWREIARNTDPDGVYRAPVASAAAQERLARPKTRRLDADRVLRAEVVALLEDGASPRQISARLRWAHPDNESMRISHEQIYQALYVQGAGSLRQQLRVDKALRSGRTRRLPRSPLAGLPRRSNRPWIEGAQISVRPPQAADRAVPGHWEGDLVIGAGGRSALITLVERTSRFVLIHRLGAGHDSQTVTTALQTMVADLPRAVRASITWDQGSEMARHADFTAATDIPVYFADPHSPWQRPTNENTNRLIREYLPKGTSFTDVTDTQVQAIQDRLNRRPRIVLNGQTPTEKLNDIINGANTT